MAEEVVGAATARAILRALADLSPTGGDRTAALSVPTDWFRWLSMSAVRLFQPPASEDPVARMSEPLFPGIPIERGFGSRLAALDQIRAERPIRAGWLWVAGRVKPEGGNGRWQRIFHPLVTVPVRVQRALGLSLVAITDPQISDLVADHQERFRLEGHMEFGGGAFLTVGTPDVPAAVLPRLGNLGRFARSTAHAAGLPAGKLVPATESPEALMRRDDVVIVAGVGVYVTGQATTSSRASSLREWADGPLDTWTALHSLYLESGPPETGAPPRHGAVESPSILTPVQRSAVAASRTAPVTVLSGAAGTGKSHTIAAIVCDALATGERVLVAAKTDATVDALLSLLERGPGPSPVVFGSNERRDALADRLSAGQLHPMSDEDIAAAHKEGAAAARRRDDLRRLISDALAAEALLASDDDGPTLAARRTAPGFFAVDVDLDHAAAILEEATASTGGGWWARHREQQARERAVASAEAPPGTTVDDLGNALVMARAVRQAAEVVARGGLELGPQWPALLRADDEARHSLGRCLACDSRSPARLNSTTLPAVGALATALRSGRAARREQLRRIKDQRLTQALPLWVGTLADVDDLLPPIACLFDLVILDEASSIDQPLAAATLLRGRRVVVAGDPQQLRHVSFVSDLEQAVAVQAQGLDGAPTLAARLDVRRNSVFDLAAGAAPVLVLDEHFRCDPHLVDFVFDRLYAGKVEVATRCPQTQSRRCITVVRIEGQRDTAGIVAAEVEWVLQRLRALRRGGATSVGVVTPFRAQADTVERAILDNFSADDVEAMDLRAGTVHEFQGNERDLVIVSLGIGQDVNASSWRFAEDSHLFAVMMTRARDHLELLLSAEPPAGGLMAGYLAHADRPPGPPPPVKPLSAWAESVASGVESGGVAVLRAYPTGRDAVDWCAADERRNRAVECDVHPGGPDAHIDRHLALARRGWEFLEGYRSRWENRRGELVVDLIAALQEEAAGVPPTSGE